ncbi:hypothetical protein [Mobiluncus mulieris]|uniref:Uncharacterized protein n=1 Tax=Mobiluncus mulieris TaxID=2052 RepID=A0A7Y0USY4_9ACTO|nr:hypothetical protein [Mobiluncus mulieris]NMX02843.1 hypothetical protein [Mobiluncus mulieris]
MDWIYNPAWWALIVAVAGTAVNGVFNWLNWKHDVPPRFRLEAKLSANSFLDGVFVLRNTGRRTVQIDRLEADLQIPEGVRFVPPGILPGNPSVLQSGESTLFRTKLRDTAHLGNREGFPRIVLVYLKGRSRPLTVELGE